ncbi:MAG: hypothetical protein ACYTFK_09385 [Planctomycetota bacterium]|jgi:hypothetical protein
MQGLTLLVSLTGCLLVFCTTPIYGLIVYVGVLVLYPSYLTLPIWTIDFTAHRIVIAAVYANLFLRTILPGRFKFTWLDKIVIIYFTCQILAGITTTAALKIIENRAGGIFDMVLPYFAVRMIVTSKEQYLKLLKGILFIAAPLAIVGVYQCLTGNNPVGFLKKYYAWEQGKGYSPIPRHGFFRADVTFSMSIMFGLFFAMFGPVCAGVLRNAKKHKALYITGLALMGTGVFASVSSGPMLAALLAGCFIVFYRWRKHWKPLVITIIILCGLVEVLSNRHFYDVLGGFTLNSRTAWYRSRLIGVALFEGGMSGHWLTGFGFADPGWSARIDDRSHTDMVNHYLLILSRYGLAAFIPFITMNVLVIRKLINAGKSAVLDSDRWLVWCLAAGLFGLAGAFVSVSLFGQPTTIYYIMTGLAGSMPVIVARSNAGVYQRLAFSYPKNKYKEI